MSGGLWLGPTPAGGEVEGFDLTTKGDLHGYDTDQARVPIGNNDEVLIADSAQGLGLKWGVVGAFGAWTPSYSNLTVGDGSVTARYTQIGGLVVARFRFDLGSTSSMGTAPAVSLPVDAANGDGNGPPLGTAICKDANGAWFPATAAQSSTTDVGFALHDPSGTYISSLQITATAPFTWTTSDVLSFQITYEAA